MKTLKIWNGRGYNSRGDHIYIAAYSRKDASQLFCEGEIKVFNLKRGVDKLSLGRANREIKEYFSEGCWGNKMEGITPERGLWYSNKDHAPVQRLI